MSEATDLLGAIGNKNHTAAFLGHYSSEIDRNSERDKELHDAPNYYAWLCVASEHILYSARLYIYRVTTDQAVFDYTYKKTLDWFSDNSHPLSSGAFDELVLFTKIRHILVHKGFPNPHEFPANNGRHITKGIVFTSDDVKTTTNDISNPSYHVVLAEAFERLQSELTQAQTAMVSRARADGTVTTST